MAGTTEHGNGKTWTPVLSILALVAGVSAVITPMYAGLLNQEKLREKSELRIDKNTDSLANIRAEMAAMQVQFAEVETQFRASKDQLVGVSGLIDTRLAQLDKMLQQEIAAQTTAGEIVRNNQKENIAAVQELKVKVGAIETYLKFAHKTATGGTP